MFQLQAVNSMHSIVPFEFPDLQRIEGASTNSDVGKNSVKVKREINSLVLGGGCAE